LQNRDDFLAIEMVKDRRIRMAWNVGDKVEEIVDNTRLEPNENGMPLDDRWYTIRATRYVQSYSPHQISEYPERNICELT
jgi:hypothetical protein